MGGEVDDDHDDNGGDPPDGPQEGSRRSLLGGPLGAPWPPHHGRHGCLPAVLLLEVKKPIYVTPPSPRRELENEPLSFGCLPGVQFRREGFDRLKSIYSVLPSGLQTSSWDSSRPQSES